MTHRMWLSKRVRGWLLALSLVLVAQTTVKAALIQQDFATPGDNLLALDTDTGLVWLRVKATINQSYNTVVSTLIAPSGIYEGYVHATQSQIETLFTHAGVDVLNGNDPSNFDGVGLITARLGYTQLDQFSAGTFGVYASSISPGAHQVAFVQQGSFGVPFNFAYAPQPGPGQGDSFASPTYGHWLVRAPEIAVVPEPSTLALAGMAAGAMFISRRKCLRRP